MESEASSAIHFFRKRTSRLRAFRGSQSRALGKEREENLVENCCLHVRSHTVFFPRWAERDIAKRDGGVNSPVPREGKRDPTDNPCDCPWYTVRLKGSCVLSAKGFLALTRWETKAPGEVQMSTSLCSEGFHLYSLSEMGKKDFFHWRPGHFTSPEETKISWMKTCMWWH